MTAKRRIGIMGGSFNPIHMAHTALADYICQTGGFDEVWLVVSPLNPLKSHPDELVDDRHRMSMTAIACNSSPRLKPCDIELSMPRPSYTIDTLTQLSAAYPDCEFSLIIGADNWAIFPQWRDSEKIIHNHGVTIYPRPGYEINPVSLPVNVTVVDAPMLDLSSTFIRRHIANGLDMSAFLPHGVGDYIKQHKLYEK